jgi:hypothetical protein
MITGAMALGANADLDELCPDRVCPSDLDRSEPEDASDEVGTLSLVTDVLLIGGAVIAGVGITLLILDTAETEEPVVAGCGPTGCTARFKF